RWDFDEEHPLRDARGFDLSREVADSSQLTDEETGLANVILTNGARLYVDHAHPEYSAPECTNPRDAVVWDKAGELVIMEGARQARLIPGAPQLNLYKNNVDNKGASYGAHENYLMRRSTPFASIVRHLTPFFVSRQVVTGAGRVGIGQDGATHGFQLSQRADYFEVEVGLETTLKRPIINTRDEPHANPDRYRRLHVIIGDANLSEISTYLKVGTTSLVLAMIEDGWLTDDLGVDRPVTALHEVSHDPTCTHLLTLKDGRKITAVQLQAEYLEQARKYVEDKYGDDADRQTKDVLHRWEQILDQLALDPMKLSDQLDWVAKYKLLQSYRDRDGLDWDDSKLHLVDLQYADLRPDRGLYYKLVKSGRMQRIVTDEEIRMAVAHPPTDTRAYFRGRCMQQYAPQVAAASWDSVIFDLPGKESLQRIPTLDPLRGTKAHVGALLDQCDTASDLVRTITGGAAG
ncbi:depupylase/deamidase Dop, partial [Kribbella sp.]|uniref:depupylase/deamidase Dop n=1 Tax=Kribbella sp. TaxID=1871183 RepID=UPI002D398557